MSNAPFWLDDRPKDIDMTRCAAREGDGTCGRRAEFMPRLVGWPANISRAYWTPENAIEIVLELPICQQHRKRYTMVEAYVQRRNWQVVVDYAQLANRPIPMRSSLMVEFVPIDHLDELRAAHRR